MADPKDFELTVNHPTGILLWKVSNQWVKAQNHVLSPLGVTHTQCVLLFLTGRLAKLGEEATQVRLAALSEMDVMVVSQGLRALEAKKLIRRRPSRRDGRAKLAELTSAGQAILDKAVGSLIETNNRFYAILGEREMRLREILKDLIDSNSRAE